MESDMERFARGRAREAICALAAVVALAGCGGGGDDEETATSTLTGQPAPPPQAGTSNNQPPQITGTPPAMIDTGQVYSFKPAVADAEGDKLSFAISNRPRWLNFDVWDGKLYGVPSQADAGTFTKVTITVSDGKKVSTLNPFDIVVRKSSGTAPVGNRAVTLGLTAPTHNIDGSTLTDLAGYRIYWGTSPGNYPYSAKIDNPGVTTHLVERLSSATWYFVATVVNRQGTESDYSDVLAVTL
jgi:putative Ig domain-containing protein